MRFGLPDTTWKLIIHIISASPEVEEAILYGSRAKGNFKPASDIDITLKGNITLNDLNKISMALDDLLQPYTFDLSIFKQIENPDLIAHIERVGKRVYVRGDKVKRCRYRFCNWTEGLLYLGCARDPNPFCHQ